jgi:hypothetical protein
MIRKGFITKEEFFDMLKEVQVEYQSRADDWKDHIRWSNWRR